MTSNHRSYSCSTLQHFLKQSVCAALAAVASFTIMTPVSAQQGELEEIVVTARFREENIQSTPIAISAFSGEELELRNIVNVEDIGLVVPNAFFRRNVSNFGPNNTIGLRGLNQVDFSYAFDPAVGVYIDDVYHSTITGSDMDLVDLERVEVLRGPQGTLFGANSLGGAMRLISKKPQGDNSGSVQATYGAYDRLDVKGMADVTIIPDKLFARLAGSSNKRDGYGERLDFTCDMIRRGTPQLAGIGDGLGHGGYGPDGPDPDALPNPLPPIAVAVGSPADNSFSIPAARDFAQDGSCSLGTLGGQQSDAGRVMLRLLASEDLEINVAADYSKSVDDPNVDAQLSPIAGGFLNAAYQNGLVVPTWGVPFIGDARWVSPDPYTNYATFSDPFEGQIYPTDAVIEAWGVSGVVDYDINEQMHAKFIAAYRTYWNEWTNDSDRTPLPMTQTHYRQEHEQFQAEARLSGVLFDDRLEWTVGGFYFDTNSRAYNTTEFGGFDYTGFLRNFVANDRFTTENTSAFVHLVYGVTERLSISGGLRYTNEDKTNTFDHGPTLRPATPLQYGQSSVDWKASVDFQFNDDIFFYAQTATGFRSEGATPRIFTTGQLGTVPSEEVITYELGAKTEFFENRVRVNVAGYYSDYDPRAILAFGLVNQCSIPSDPNPEPFFLAGGLCPAGTFFAGTTGLPWFFYSSAPGTLQGFEVEASASPVENLLVNFTLGYTEYNNDETDTTSFFYRDPSALLQPEWNMSGGASYEFHLANGGTITPRLDWFYQSELSNGPTGFINPTFGYEQNTCPEQCIPSYHVFNARLTYESPDSNWRISLSATNLFDEFYWQQLGPEKTISSVTGIVTDTAGRSGVASRPREWALTIERRF